MSFTQRDLEQINKHGLSLERVEEQLQHFVDGFEYLAIERVATVGDGIVRLSAEQQKSYVELYTKSVDSLRVVKFVPASGAATRMFKQLFEYASSQSITPQITELIENVPKLALWSEVGRAVERDDSLSIVKAILNYGSELPKALIIFHRYDDESRTAMDEHLVEGSMYARSGEQVAIHFTISQEHRAGFVEQAARVQKSYEQRYGVRYHLSYSVQQHSSDTIAVSLDNQPFREEDGSLLFRPAGHGALLDNLNHIDADLIFIKNIDNVTTDRLKADTVQYNRAAAGLLLDIQSRIFTHLHALAPLLPQGGLCEQIKGKRESNLMGGLCEQIKSSKQVNIEEILSKIESFIATELSYELPKHYHQKQINQRGLYLYSLLNRPIRICAMVINEGEPGGGPFWVRGKGGQLSLQIAEPSQIAPEQSHLLKEGTHFNPVALICGVRDFRGDKFDLIQFVDPSSGFISEKSKQGRALKALELPGLWNGSMSDWHTLFIEMPLSTFSPVKEVKDLLREEHQ